MFVERKKFLANKIDFQIFLAEKAAIAALDKVKALKNQKNMGKSYFLHKELVPIPYKDKLLEHKINQGYKQKKKKSSLLFDSKGFLLKVIKIQSHFRRFLTRKRFKNVILSAVRVQKWCKGFLARRHYKKLYQAVIKIQKFYRSYFPADKAFGHINIY